METWQWSWLLKRAQLTVPTAFQTGTANTVYGSPTVTIVGGVVDAAHQGRQFRVGVASPILTIVDVDTVGNTYTLSENWEGITATGQQFSVYQAYLPLPSDFHSIQSLVDPATYWPIQTENVTLEMIDRRDPQRSVVGSPPRVFVPYDYFNGAPRYELWPHQKSQAFYLMAYESRPADPFDSGADVPALVPSDIILERGLMYACQWPGPNRNDPNPYYSMNNAKMHEDHYNKRLGVLIKQDVEHMQRAIWYQEDQTWNQRNLNAAYMQAHDLTRW